MRPYSLYICDKVIRIEEEMGSFLRFCRGYIVKEPAPAPDFTISVSKDEIIRQLQLSESNWEDQLCGEIIARKLAMLLLKNERCLFIHGSVVAFDNSSILFTAPSGVGKTTHTQLWVKYLPEAYILNGDKPFVTTEGKIVAWGSPWCGSEHFNRNEGKELKAICFLERANRNRIMEISADEAIPLLAFQTGDPDPSDYRTKIWMMEGLARLRGRVKFFRYEMNNLKEEEAFHTTYDVLSKL